MADDKYFDGILDFGDNWGEVVRDGKIKPATGKAVQDFIKGPLINSRVGYFLNKEDGNVNILRGFANQEAARTWDAAADKNADDIKELVLTEVSLSKGEPQPYKIFSLVNHTKDNYGNTVNNIVSVDGKVALQVEFVSIQMEPTGSSYAETPFSQDCEFVVEVRENNNWVPKRHISAAANEIITIDLSNDLFDGKYSVRVKCSGEVEGNTNAVSYNITKTKVNFSLASNWHVPQKSTRMNLSFNITGSVDKTIVMKITGAGGKTERTESAYIGLRESGEVPESVEIKDTDKEPYKIATEGIHNIEAYVSIKNNGVEVAKTDTLVFQILMLPQGDTATPYIILNQLNTNITNWVQETIFNYAIYDSVASTANISIKLSDYNHTDINYLNYTDTVETNTPLKYTGFIEIEGYDKQLYAALNIGLVDNLDNDDYNYIYQIDPIDIIINNEGGFSPTAGATFILNPRLRSNNEDESKLKNIYNSANNNEKVIDVAWSDNFSFGIDGWVTDNNNNKCLRVLGGQVLTINPGLFKNLDPKSSSFTIEMMIATRNVVTEDIPLLRISKTIDDSRYIGFELKPLQCSYLTSQNTNPGKQDVGFKEGSVTHIAVNVRYKHALLNDVKPEGSYVRSDDAQLNLVRMYVNGVMNREFMFDTGDETLDKSMYIQIGDENAEADIDIHGIRFYDKGLSSGQILQDYISMLPDLNKKIEIKNKNSIMSIHEDGGIDDQNQVPFSGTLSFNLIRNKYNTLLWTPPASGSTTTTRFATCGDGSKTKQKGDLHITVYNYDDDGNPVIDLKRSGVINDMTVKGQGTSSMNYWKWNQRWEFGDDSKFIPQEESNKPDFDKDEYMKIADASWQPVDGAPYAKRLDGKINWASSPQSHKLGSVGLYDALFKQCVGKNDINRFAEKDSQSSKPKGPGFTGTTDGYASCRVSIAQLPFFAFCQSKADEAPVFQGLFTFGPSKGDKPTFGYNKKDFPDYVMMEGCDNDRQLVLCRVPWNSKDVTNELNSDGEYESFFIGSEDQWEVSMGDKTPHRVAIEPDENGIYHTNPVIYKFKELNNLCYLCSNSLNYFDGTYADLVRTTESDYQGTPAPTGVDFCWVTKGAPNDPNYPCERYDVFRIIQTSKGNMWVPAGVEYEGDQYESLNLSQQLSWTPGAGSYEEHNEEFKLRRGQLFKDKVFDYVHKDELIFTLQFLKLIAATDNWAKNTYLYNPGIYEQDDTGDIIFDDADDRKYYRMATAEELSNNDIQKYSLVSKIGFFQDDLDTIFLTINTGHRAKPYYIEEHDTNSDGSTWWNGTTNNLYSLTVKYFEDDLRTMMHKILDAMRRETTSNSITACFDKYYNKITEYFPAIAYNEIARLLYEDAAIHEKIYKDPEYKIPYYPNTADQDPLGQFNGDQREVELDWQERRAIFLSSYAMFGEFDVSDSTGESGTTVTFRTASLPNGSDATYHYNLKSSMYLYPSMGSGSSSLLTIEDDAADRKWPSRVKPGDIVRFKKQMAQDQNLFLRGSNYYTDFGNFGCLPTSSSDNYPFKVSGNKITELIIDDTYSGENYPTGSNYGRNMSRSVGLYIDSAPSLKKLVVGGQVLNDSNGIPFKIYRNTIDLSHLLKLEYVDLSAASTPGVKVPQNSNLHTLILPESVDTLYLDKLQRLYYPANTSTGKGLIIKKLSNIRNVNLDNCKNINSYQLLNDIFNSNGRLSSIDITGINWNDVPISFMNKIMDISADRCKLTGIINIRAGEVVNFDLKMKMLNAFNNVDDNKNSLKINYNKVTAVERFSSITGKSSIYNAGDYKFSVNYKGNGGADANDFNNIEWYVNGETSGEWGEISKTGILTFRGATNFQQNSLDIKCVIYREGATTFILNKTVEIKKVLAKVGDWVYADGTYGAPAEDGGDKKKIGVCIYASMTGDPDTQERIAASLDIIRHSQDKSNYKNCANFSIWGRAKIGLYSMPMSSDSNIDPVVPNVQPLLGSNTDTSIRQTGIRHTQYNTVTWNGMDLSTNQYNGELTSGQMGPMSIVNNQYDYNAYIDGQLRSAIYDAKFVQHDSKNMPIGKYNTIKMISAYNDNLANYNQKLYLGDFNNWRNDSDIQATSKIEYINKFFESLGALDSNQTGAGSVLCEHIGCYYPAAQYCTAYEPIMSTSDGNLSSKFIAGEWFLPSAGELSALFILANEYRNQISNDGNSMYAAGCHESLGKLSDIIDDINNIYKPDIGTTASYPSFTDINTPYNIFWSSTESVSYVPSDANINTTSGANNSGSYAYAVGKIRINNNEVKPCITSHVNNYYNNALHYYSDNAKRQYGHKFYAYNLWPFVQF